METDLTYSERTREWISQTKWRDVYLSLPRTIFSKENGCLKLFKDSLLLVYTEATLDLSIRVVLLKTSMFVKTSSVQK